MCIRDSVCAAQRGRSAQTSLFVTFFIAWWHVVNSVSYTHLQAAQDSQRQRELQKSIGGVADPFRLIGLEAAGTAQA